MSTTIVRIKTYLSWMRGGGLPPQSKSVGPQPFLTDLSSDTMPAPALKSAHWVQPHWLDHNVCSSCTIYIW